MQGSSLSKDSLEKKAREGMRTNKDMGPMAVDLKVSTTVASNTNTGAQKPLKYKRAKGLKHQFHWLKFLSSTSSGLEGGGGGDASLPPLLLSYPTGSKAHEILARTTEQDT
jgi:hypothetical protein